MALTVGQLAVHIRAAADAASVPAEVSTVLGAMKAWGDLAIERAAPSAPEAYRDMALIVLVGYVYDRPNAPRGSQYSNAMLNSGASSILKPYLRRNAIILDDTVSGAAASESGGATIQVVDNRNGNGKDLLVTLEDGTQFRFPQMQYAA